MTASTSTASSSAASVPVHSFPFRDPTSISALRDSYERDGFVIVDGIFGPDPKTAQRLISDLRSSAQDVVQLTRDGKWPHRRVVGKQFPPFDEITQDYWGVQHLMSPALPHSSVFTRLYGDNVLDVSALLLNVSSSNEMQLELFNLLINPLHHAFALGWHRDDVKPDISPEDEKALMVGSHDPNSTASATKDGGGIQWNAALYDDACLFVVPGTHRRIRTEEERRANALPPPPPTVIPEGSALSEKEKQALDGSWDGVDPPTTQRVFLKAGQTAFYSQRILHRASYLPTQIRATLHGCYGVCIAPVAPPPAASSTALQDTTNATADLGTSGATAAAAAATAATIVSEQRARNVLQHGVEWMKDPAFGACLPDRLRPMWDNLLRMERQWAGKELGFSLDN